MDIIRKIAKQVGVDKAIFFTSSARIATGIGGIVSVLFITRYLTGIEQGFYYTFGSILAIQVFFELGLNGIITQYVAHEVSQLTLNGDRYEGKDKYLSRIASLLHFCVKWYGTLAGVLLLILIIAGYVFFSYFYKDGAVVDWFLPWMLLSFGTTFYFMLSPFIAFIEGLGKVKEVAKMRFVQQGLTMLINWSGLFFGLKLYVGGVSTLIGVGILSYLSARKYMPLLHNIYCTKISERVSYHSEIFPYQWKIAVSWMSGYFIFSLFNPVLFATEGAVAAGQMGMTLAALGAIHSLSMSWMNTKVPLYSSMIALKKYYQLDTIFDSTLKQLAFINGLALIFMLMVIIIIRHYHFTIDGMYLGDRFLGYLPMVLMMVPLFLNQFIFSWATYLRCHKKEPFLLISIVTGILCSLSTILLGKYYGVLGITLGYCSITLFTFIWGYLIFIKKKNEWHLVQI